MPLFINSKLLTLLLTVGMIFSISACSRQIEDSESTDDHINTSLSDRLEKRQDIMYDWNTSIMIMNGMIKNSEKFDADMFKKEANFLAENNHAIWQYFTDNKSDRGNSTEEIWNNPKKWQTEIDKFQQATIELQTKSQETTDIDELQLLVDSVSESCQSCHAQFKSN